MSDYTKNAENIIKYLGGAGNIAAVSNCMTRLRVVVRSEEKVNEAALSSVDDVMELIHDCSKAYEIVVGPGKSRKYADICKGMGLGSDPDQTAKTDDDWKKFKKKQKSKQKSSPVKYALKTLGDVFIPLIPGIIAAGLCAGFAALIAGIIPDYENIPAWNLAYNILSLVNVSFMTYITAWAGYRAAERFGATPILGGMLGMITSLDGINTVAAILGLANKDAPLASVLHSGKGGVLAVLFGVLLLAFVEKKIRSKMPDSVDVIFTPLLTILICVIPYVLIIMPLFGFISSGIAWIFGELCLSSSIVVRMIVGFVSAAIFLPLVATGMHHGLVALYTVQLQQLGYVTLYPALAMAGAGQVGAALALRGKAKRVGNTRLCSVINGALPAGFLGIGEPLIYGVTLPLGKPFITAGIGAGFGGALVMAFEVASTTWGPSGLLGAFVMTAGPSGVVTSVLVYLAGLGVSYVCSYIITALTYDEKELIPENDSGSEPVKKTKKAEKEEIPETVTAEHRTVRHGEKISFRSVDNPFFYTITDPVGIHARPAGELVTIAGQYDCSVEVSANGKTASASSLMQLMNLGAVCGTTLQVSAKGKDAQEALAAIQDFLKKTL